MFSELTSLKFEFFIISFIYIFVQMVFIRLMFHTFLGTKVHAQSIITLATVFIIKVVIVLLSCLKIQFHKNSVVSVAFIVAKDIF